MANSKFRYLWRTVIGSVADLLFPPSCLVCGHPPSPGSTVMFCPDCLERIELIDKPLCSCCGRMFRAAAGGEHLCGRCLTGRWFFDMARALVIYREPISDVIHRFKYQGQTVSLKSFHTLFHDLVTIPEYLHPDLVVPVPLHPGKLRQRGFNQAVLLAEALYLENRELVNHAVLERVRKTAPQTGLSGKERRRNLKNAFQINKPEQVKNRTIVLVDDVFTTGTTVNECARILKKAGAKKVLVFTLARVAE